MRPTTNDQDAEVIDLAAISRPARRVVEIYDQAKRGRTPKPGQLDDALCELDAIPHPPGQLGADIALLTSGGIGGTRQHVASAIERLRKISTVQPKPAPAQRVKKWKPRRRQPRSPKTIGQLQLPGIEPDTGAAS